MMSMDSSILNLYQQKLISREAALEYAVDSVQMEKRLGS
jgi:Tfp pilus assembly pilus retraction ATPase PilT